MNVSLFQAAAAMKANSHWQEVIAENLSASSIPGFKKKELFTSAVSMGGRAAPGAAASSFVMPSTGVATNFQPGALKFTGAKTDTAIEGPGFFEVQLPNGATGYTRDGEFQINAQSQLVTKSGYPVLSSTGPVQLDPNNSNPISISATGDISQGSAVRGTLKLVEPSDPTLLTPITGGYFLANDPNLRMQVSANPLVRQGYLEGANTSPVAEMAHLITAMRMFEANQRIIQSQDERTGRTITELGNLN
jgi:flagellar basal-body rod protein FlgG